MLLVLALFHLDLTSSAANTTHGLLSGLHAAS